MFNRIRTGLVNESSEKMLRLRFYLKYGLHVFAENASVPSQNVELLNKLSNNEIEIQSIDNILTNSAIPQCQISPAQNQNQSKTGDLHLKLKIGAKVISTVNVDTKD